MASKTKKAYSAELLIPVTELTYERLHAEAVRRECSVDQLAREMLEIALQGKGKAS